MDRNSDEEAATGWASACRIFMDRMRIPSVRYVGCRGLCGFGDTSRRRSLWDSERQVLIERANGTDGTQRCCFCFK